MSERINLAEIEARCEAATPGPWFLRKRESFDAVDVMHDKDGRPCWTGKFEMEDDAFFVAMARTDLPALVAWVKDAREVLERVREIGYTGAMMDSTIDLVLSRLEEVKR